MKICNSPNRQQPMDTNEVSRQRENLAQKSRPRQARKSKCVLVQ